MSSRWAAYPEASLDGFEQRCTRPGNRNHAAIDALDNYEAELISNRKRDAYFKQLDAKTTVAKAIMNKVGEEE